MVGKAGLDAVAAIAERYHKAMVAGDAHELSRLFDARAPIVGQSEGELLRQDLGAFIAEAAGLVGQHGQETCTVESVRLDGDIAAAAVRGRHAGLWLLDHLSLVEIDGDWRLAAKTFRVVDEPSRPLSRGPA